MKALTVVKAAIACVGLALLHRDTSTSDVDKAIQSLRPGEVLKLETLCHSERLISLKLKHLNGRISGKCWCPLQMEGACIYCLVLSRYHMPKNAFTFGFFQIFLQTIPGKLVTLRTHVWTFYPKKVHNSQTRPSRKAGCGPQ